MTERDVEIVRAVQPDPQTNILDLFSGEPDEAALRAAAHFAEDFVCIQHGLSDEPRHGLRGMREGFRDWLEPWDHYRTEIERLIDCGDRVLVLTRDFGRSGNAATEVEMLGAALWTVKDGKVTRAEFFPDRAEAYEAAGVQP